ncbi:DUF4194 domain-containing protein [Magnetospirillum molischianum]|uniref:DUF4194 domain-containing protein n=1 Tax=Magnetospirillum molischianum DSM 120 TaxID=1150626 RepID=H8FMU9_MAGML|nr:DUF4194 domain-containing protein [Magnetospirillum molischianum]CCG39687.1 conserved hypothetical protein [Magnetospirillum molischianum DSM 120]
MPAILAELTTFEEKVAASKGQAAAERAVGTLRRALNVLLDRQFIYNGDRGMAPLYEALLRPDVRQIVEGVLDALGYALVVETTDQWIGVVPSEGGELHGARLRIDETIILLLLGLVWQEGMNTGLSEDRATVPTTSEEVFARHAAILGRERIPRARFQDILLDLRRRALIEIGEEDPETRDMILRIRSTIRLVSGEAQVQMIERFAQETDRRLDGLDREAARREAGLEEMPEDEALDEDGEV